MSDNATTTKSKATRKQRIGIVVSNKAAKTITVKVERRVPHPLFKKIVRLSSKFHAHDEEEKAEIGDKVLIGETRPMSKTKRWELLNILKH